MSSQLSGSKSDQDPSRLAGLVGHDTEAGRILASLYGKPKPVVSAPKPVRSSSWAPAQAWRRPQHSPEAADPRAATLNREAIAAVDADKPGPIVVRQAQRAPIDLLDSRRRSAQAIADATEAEAATADRPAGPPVKPGYNIEAEKRRLQLTFQFKGGKGLPAEGLSEPLTGHIPIPIITGTGARTRKARTEQQALTRPASASGVSSHGEVHAPGSNNRFR